ncbi:MAG: dTDP-4-dehydrorhamnose reductase [Balneolaceae bacterium]
MKYLITGAGGQLGSEWVRFLSEQKVSFKAYGSDGLNISDRSRLDEIFDKEIPDIVINCAAYTKVDQAENEPDEAFLVNETGVKNLVEVCKQTGSKLVHFSTDYVFPGESSDNERYPEGYPEDAETNPVNVYGKSKRAGEVILEQSGIHWLLVRVSWLCGATGHNFVKTMIRLAGEKDSLNVVNDQFGTPAFTFDVVERTSGLIQRNQAGIFHISSSGKISWADFAREIFNQTGQLVVVNEVSSSEFNTVAKRPAFSLLSNRKIVTSGLPQPGWKEGLETLIRQLKNQ